MKITLYDQELRYQQGELSHTNTVVIDKPDKSLILRHGHLHVILKSEADRFEGIVWQQYDHIYSRPALIPDNAHRFVIMGNGLYAPASEV